MKVIILAAGASRRLGLNQPKSLIKLKETNLIEIQLNQLLKAGISPKDINIVATKSFLKIIQLFLINFFLSFKNDFCK